MNAQVINTMARPETPYWQGLAWAIANAQPGGDFMVALRCLFNDLSPADQARCRAEVDECRKAKRGELQAVVVWGRDATAEEQRTHHLG